MGLFNVTRHQNLKNLALAPGRILGLQEFQGVTASGHHDSLHKLTMARMNMEDASFVITHHDADENDADESFTIEGRISGVE